MPDGNLDPHERIKRTVDDKYVGNCKILFVKVTIF